MTSEPQQFASDNYSGICPEAWTAMAIGYRGDPARLPDELRERDLTPRPRKPLSQFVFAARWGDPSPLVD
jgi:hypothetical protein